MSTHYELPGPRSVALEARRQAAVPRGLASMTPIYAASGSGWLVTDVDGNELIDFAGGLGVLNAGHTPGPVVEAVRRQAGKLLHGCSMVTMYEPYVALAERLHELTPGDFPKKTLLVNSGAEAVENAVKIARAATGRPGVVVFDNGFHGRTLFTLAMTARAKGYKDGFHPLPGEVHRLPFPYPYRHPLAQDDEDACAEACLTTAENLLRHQIGADTVAAVVVEPVQGEGGFIVAPRTWLQRIARLCVELEIPLIVDEIQTGFGRTGTMYAIEQFPGVVPDIILTSKSLAAGLPLAAITGRATLMDAPGPGGLGSTFGGNPVSCAAALATIDFFEEEGLLGKAQVMGDILGDRLAHMAKRHPLVGEARRLGAMAALELVTDRNSREPAARQTRQVLDECLSRGLIIIKAGTYDNVLRVLAPLSMPEEYLHKGLDILDESLTRVEERAAE